MICLQHIKWTNPNFKTNCTHESKILTSILEGEMTTHDKPPMVKLTCSKISTQLLATKMNADMQNNTRVYIHNKNVVLT